MPNEEAIVKLCGMLRDVSAGSSWSAGSRRRQELLVNPDATTNAICLVWPRSDKALFGDLIIDVKYKRPSRGLRS